MSIRVLATDEAKASIQRIAAILAGGLADQIRSLKTEGQTLSDPNVWDGMLAENFRSDTWPSASSTLDAVAQSLDELQRDVASINTDIMMAGGNG